MNSNGNGVVRIGRKGLREFAFGESGEPFSVDVVAAFTEWVSIDSEFRQRSEDGTVQNCDIQSYHEAATKFVKSKGGTPTSVAESLEFLARLREIYDELVHFFQPRLPEGHDSPATSGVELQFSEEEN